MKHIPTFESFLNESRYSIYKKEIEWKQHPKKSGSYIAKSGKSELEILSSGYGNWELRVDGKEVMPSETAKEKSAKDNHTNYNNWADDKVGTLKHTAQEMFESLVNESLRSGPNGANTYPIKKGDDPEDLLSGRSRDNWECEKSVSDLLDVFGNEMSIYKGDEITEYLQVNSRDTVAYVYKIVRRDLRGRRTAGYIPSHYRNYDQTQEINSTRF